MGEILLQPSGKFFHCPIMLMLTMVLMIIIIIIINFFFIIIIIIVNLQLYQCCNFSTLLILMCIKKSDSDYFHGIEICSKFKFFKYSNPAFRKLWSAEHKWSSGSALVVVLDWTLVQKRQKHINIKLRES
jgi:hypothetical protein